MKKWDGKSRGNLLGYRIFVFCIRHLGVRAAYLVLAAVSAWYALFLSKSNRYIFYYFHKRLGFNYIKSKISILKSYYCFGQTLVDRTAISAGRRGSFTYDFDGVESLKKMMADKKGGILISAHIGNFELAEVFFADIDFDYQVHIVTTDAGRSEIKEYLQSVSRRRQTTKFIIVKEDMSHIFEISAALSSNGLVCFTGDRYFEGSTVLSHEFLGQKASFPAGPFTIASRLQVPTAFVYVMKEPRLHYHLYARIADNQRRRPEILLNSYTKNLEAMVYKYPLQWFNYFDFWDSVDGKYSNRVVLPQHKSKD